MLFLTTLVWALYSLEGLHSTADFGIYKMPVSHYSVVPKIEGMQRTTMNRIYSFFGCVPGKCSQNNEKHSEMLL